MLANYANQTMSVKRVTGRSLSGDATFETFENVACRFESDRRLTRNQTGQEVVSEATVFTEFDVHADDRIVFDGREYPIVNVLKAPDLSGATRLLEVIL